MIYTGRLEHRQKRILALPELSRLMTDRGVAHELTIVGDGPAREELLTAIADNPRITVRSPVGPSALAALLDVHDLFVLPSRYEGLSVSMLEAMSRGCVPIVARTDSGAADAIDPGVNGEIADAAPADDEATTARALADAVRVYLRRDAGGGAMRGAAVATAHGRYSVQCHADAVERVLNHVAASEPRAWPADRACAFASSGASVGTASGTVPADGADRLRAALAALAGKRVVIHGTGRHTRELAGVLAESPATIVAMADDDRQLHGRTLWGWPIVNPADAGRTGATDVVISSWMHEPEIWARRAIYERQRLVVHRLYASNAD